jgi:osmotically-inducible protein OsmY
MKKHTMFLVLTLAMLFAYASARAAQHPMGGSQGMGGQPGMQSPNNPNNPNNPNGPMNQPDMGPDTNQQANANTAKVSDSDLQNAVKSKLAADPAFVNVQAAVDKGKVTLDGSVNSKEDKKKAKKAVESIAGVRGVKEHLTVAGNESSKPPKQTSSAGPGMAFLSSQDAAQGNASQNTAGSIAGNSNTSANPTSTAPQATTPEAGSMQQSGANPASAGANTLSLQQQIEAQIKNDPSLTDSTVSVNVGDNSIDLSGTVGSNKAKMNAERIAQSYAQNRKVNSNLQVTGAGNSDLNNGHSAMSNGTTTTPKGDSSQMPQTNPQPQADQTTPH